MQVINNEIVKEERDIRRGDLVTVDLYVGLFYIVTDIDTTTGIVDIINLTSGTADQWRISKIKLFKGSLTIKNKDI